MAFRRPLKFVVNKNSSQAGGNSTFALMSNDDISLIRQQAIYELAKDPVYRLLVTVQGDGELDTISDTRVTSAAAVLALLHLFLLIQVRVFSVQLILIFVGYGIQLILQDSILMHICT